MTLWHHAISFLCVTVPWSLWINPRSPCNFTKSYTKEIPIFYQRYPKKWGIVNEKENHWVYQCLFLPIRWFTQLDFSPNFAQFSSLLQPRRHGIGSWRSHDPQTVDFFGSKKIDRIKLNRGRDVADFQFDLFGITLCLIQLFFFTKVGVVRGFAAQTSLIFF